MPNKKNVLVLFSIILIGIFGTLSFYYGFYMIKIDEINMDITIGKKIGFNTDRDALHFGTIYPGAESTRKILIKNNNDFPVTITIKNIGELADWVKLEKNNFIIDKYQNSSILYRVISPNDVNLGNYESTSIIYIKRKFI